MICAASTHRVYSISDIPTDVQPTVWAWFVYCYSSTAVLATFDSSNPVSSTNDFKVRLASISILHFLFDLLKIFYGQG